VLVVTSRPQKTARRKPPGERRTEIVDAASAIAVSDGLEKVTAKRVAEILGVYPGLVNHYFPTADELVAVAFGTAAAAEREELFAAAESVATPVTQIQTLLEAWLDNDRDPVSLLWLDAWQASRRRPALRAEVVHQMQDDSARLARIVTAGMMTGEFAVNDAEAAAIRIMSLIDGLSVQAAVRTALDYTGVREMVITTSERILGLEPGSISAAGVSASAR
jgi:AcrR family transcriptional regulator